MLDIKYVNKKNLDFSAEGFFSLHIHYMLHVIIFFMLNDFI